VRLELAFALGEVETVSSGQTVAALLITWLETIAEIECSVRSYERYGRRVKKIIPHIGVARLGNLMQVHIVEMFGSMEKMGGWPWTRRMALQILRITLRQPPKAAPYPS
jgi:hypothetical protein